MQKQPRFSPLQDLGQKIYSASICSLRVVLLQDSDNVLHYKVAIADSAVYAERGEAEDFSAQEGAGAGLEGW